MILLTRPYDDSKKLAEKLGDKECIIEPMLEIEKLDYKINSSAQAVVSTSKNIGVKTDIYIPEHGKDAGEILQYCLSNLHPNGGKIIYLSGDNITLDVAAELQKNGYDAERVICYKQVSAEKFSDEFLANFEKIKTASFFSRQTIKNFLQLSEKYNLNTKNIICICISENVSRETNAENWKEIKIAEEANLQSMLKILSC